MPKINHPSPFDKNLAGRFFHHSITNIQSDQIVDNSIQMNHLSSDIHHINLAQHLFLEDLLEQKIINQGEYEGLLDENLEIGQGFTKFLMIKFIPLLNIFDKSFTLTNYITKINEEIIKISGIQNQENQFENILKFCYLLYMNELKNYHNQSITSKFLSQYKTIQKNKKYISQYFYSSSLPESELIKYSKISNTDLLDILLALNNQEIIYEDNNNSNNGNLQSGNVGKVQSIENSSTKLKKNSETYGINFNLKM